MEINSRNALNSQSDLRVLSSKHPRNLRSSRKPVSEIILVFCRCLCDSHLSLHKIQACLLVVLVVAHSLVRMFARKLQTLCPILRTPATSSTGNATRPPLSTWRGCTKRHMVMPRWRCDMPLTKKGKTILASMMKEYPTEKKAKQVFYASANAGKIVGVHK